MQNRIEVRPLRFWEWTLDGVMLPVMWGLQWCALESPQQTHRWNNHHLKKEDVAYLEEEGIVEVNGDPSAPTTPLFGFIPRFHLARCGGWQGYAVLAPQDHITEEWYIGWDAPGHAIGVSRLPLTGSVRVLKGPGSCKFFGITADGRQIRLTYIGEGRTGSGGPWRFVPLR